MASSTLKICVGQEHSRHIYIYIYLDPYFNYKKWKVISCRREINIGKVELNEKMNHSVSLKIKNFTNSFSRVFTLLSRALTIQSLTLHQSEEETLS